MLKVELMTMFYLFLFIKQWIFSRLPLNKNSNQMFSIIGVKILDKFYLVSYLLGGFQLIYYENEKFSGMSIFGPLFQHCNISIIFTNKNLDLHLYEKLIK